MTKNSCRSAVALAAILAAAVVSGCNASGRLRGGCGPCDEPCADPCAAPCEPCPEPCAGVLAPPADPAAQIPQVALAALTETSPTDPSASVEPAEVAAGPTGPAALVAPPDLATEKRCLFDRVGGAAGITSLVDGFIRTIATDHRVTGNPLVKQRMKKVSIATLRQHFIDHLTELTGGPKQYTGRDMKSSHEGLQISAYEWDAGVEDLVSAMSGCGFGERERSEIVDLIRPMRDQIVELP